jgi:hypothetical protein
MKINVTNRMNDFSGTVIKDEKDQFITLRSLIVNALLNGPSDNKEDGMAKLTKGQLARRIFEEDEVDINENEIIMIKDVCGKSYGPLAVLYIYEALAV